MSTLNLIAIRDGENNGAFYSPAKEKAANRGPFSHRFPFLNWLRQVAKLKLFLLIFFVGGYTVLINTWKRNSLLKKSVTHYASCYRTDAIHVVWSESDPPSDSLKAYLIKIVMSESQAAHKPNFKFDINKEDNLNNRFKLIQGLRTYAIFSVDDGVIFPCDSLDFAFTVWQTAPSAMVGFVTGWVRRGTGEHIMNMEDGGMFGGWALTVWFCLKQRSFIGNTLICIPRRCQNPSMSIYKREVLTRTSHFPFLFQTPYFLFFSCGRNCEDIAMSLLVANATAAPPIWVKGKIYEIGSSGISSLNDHSTKRHKCLNDFTSLYVSTNVKAVDVRNEWFW